MDPFQSVVEALAASSHLIDSARKIIVVGAGKASARMAEAAEEVLGTRIADGWINTKYDHGAPLRRVNCHQCRHPVPDETGVAGSQKIAQLAQAAGDGDLVLCLISGGASALLPLPLPPLTLGEMQETTELLLASGASIHEINTVRKHLSAIQGGRLAQKAAPASVLSLILSDVVGDDLEIIGSGPTVPDSSTFADAKDVLRRRKLWDRVPQTVRVLIGHAANETPKLADGVWDRVHNRIIGSNRKALLAAKRKAEDSGFTTLILSSSIEGEAREIGRMHGAILREICQSRHPLPRPACILSGGETTVTLQGNGKGGRNQELVLAATREIAGLSNVLLMSVGTDGTDGPTNAAGAWADGTTLERSRELGWDLEKHLLQNDSYPFFRALGNLIITGPTRTNVMDLCIMLAE